MFAKILEGMGYVNIDVTRGVADWSMPGGQVSDINFTKVNYLMQIAVFLKLNIKIEAI